MKESTHTNNKQLARSIRLTWDSLDSHLDDTYDPVNDKVRGNKKLKEVHGGRRFHLKCVREYAVIIKTLVDQLK